MKESKTKSKLKGKKKAITCGVLELRERTFIKAE